MTEIIPSQALPSKRLTTPISVLIFSFLIPACWQPLMGEDIGTAGPVFTARPIFYWIKVSVPVNLKQNCPHSSKNMPVRNPTLICKLNRWRPFTYMEISGENWIRTATSSMWPSSLLRRCSFSSSPALIMSTFLRPVPKNGPRKWAFEKLPEHTGEIWSTSFFLNRCFLPALLPF